MTTALVWFRRDLRLHDNEALAAVADADTLVPVYVFDPRWYGARPYGGADSFSFQKTGPHRVRFRCEAVSDLRDSLGERGSALVVREGRAETVLGELAAAVDADVVSMHTWPTPEESGIEADVKGRLRADGVEVTRSWGHTLYHINDLPTPYTDIADTYTSFRKSVEREASVREQVSTPSLPPTPEEVGAEVPTGAIPDPEALVGDETGEAWLDGPDERSVLPFRGGESAALERVESYLWGEDRLREYKETRNGMLGADYSSKLSPWLNEGCLSPRHVHDEVKRYENQRVKNDSTYWLVFELLWRDFFQFQAAKHGTAFFAKGGLRERTDIDWRDDDAAFERWARGETGIPFVDANMRELNRTGYVSNRGRQNAASFLVNNLRLDWRRGAAYYETQLVDFDPCSNYGNWAYIAGVGNDSRDRYFNIVKQARKYDPDGEYVKQWLPELDPLPAADVHEPWKLDSSEEATYGVKIGVDYPEPMLDLAGSYEKLR